MSVIRYWQPFTEFTRDKRTYYLTSNPIHFCVFPCDFLSLGRSKNVDRSPMHAGWNGSVAPADRDGCCYLPGWNRHLRIRGVGRLAHQNSPPPPHWPLQIRSKSNTTYHTYSCPWRSRRINTLYYTYKMWKMGEMHCFHKWALTSLLSRTLRERLMWYISIDI